ncbi:MAG: hypothetical protein RBS19_00380 [Bacteroidales bacterium]|nr:hypothetical protein [Bacteroidales bacterium]
MEKKTSHSRFFSLLKQIPRADKEELVWQYSHYTTTSLREFSATKPKEYEKMLEDMQALASGINNSELKRLRSAILHRLQRHGVDTTDWKKVNAFLEQKRVAGKPLYSMSIEDMQALIPKMEAILRKDKAINEKMERLACLN